MRRCSRGFILATFLAHAAALVAVPVWANVPPTLTEQGRLFDAAGAPLNTTVEITFSLYATATGGTALWTETQTLVLDQGYFSAQLGSSTPLPSSVWDGSVRYVGITVGNDSELSPRQTTSSVPYAWVAGDAVGDIHPITVSVNGTLVIDAQGNWVGPATGLMGPQGPAGPVGPAGATGAAGAIGPTGPQGAAGTNGAIGPTGPQGAAGTNGAAGAGYFATSTTSFTIGTGSKAFTTAQSGLAYQVGQRVRVTNSTSAYMEGAVTAYSGTSLTVNIDRTVGSGTFASWSIGVAGDVGAVGPTGAAGAAGAIGSTGPQGAAGTNGSIGPTGPQGAAGAMGPTGPAGAIGPTGPSGIWPAGSYCILQRGGSCPAGFSSGNVYWDDEDDFNASSHSGAVPDGQYDSNTRLYFCCK